MKINNLITNAKLFSLGDIQKVWEIFSKKAYNETVERKGQDGVFIKHTRETVENVKAGFYQSLEEVLDQEIIKTNSDIYVLKQILKESFLDDKFTVYRTGNKKQTLSISSISTSSEKIVKKINEYEAILTAGGVYGKLWKINGSYFNDLIK